MVAGTPAAAQVGYDVLERGGNAADATVATLLALNVTFGEAASFPSVAPLLYYDAASDQVESYIGAGKAPARATIEYFHSKGHTVIPKMSILAQLVPASPDVIVRLLKQHGTMTFAELSKPAIQLARDGFPVYKTTAKNLNMNIFKRIGYSFLMPYNAQVYLRGKWWQPIEHKQRLQLPDLARTLEEIAQAETNARKAGKSRAEGLDAVRDYFYSGPIADKIVELHVREQGLISRTDLSEYQGGIERPLSMEFGDLTLYTNDTWNQGIVVLMALKMLEKVDFSTIKHNSPEYIHLVAQAIELAMADREAFIGDPAFVNVPVSGLLSSAYGLTQRNRMTPRAFGKMPEPGDPWKFAREKRKVTTKISTSPQRTVSQWDERLRNETESAFAWNGNVGKDTSYIAIVDEKGNAVSLTPSDFPMSPMVPGTGLTLGIRMTQFRLDANSPTSLAPGKRPRITPHALMIKKHGKFYMSFGTPGADMQTQALVQVFLNHFAYGMDLQRAIESPRFRSRNWPDSFSPHEYLPGQIDLEEELYESAGRALSDLGYQTQEFPSMDNTFSAPGAIAKQNGLLYAGADPRESTTARGK
ncbi:MAG: gamma-glutamyltransferase [Spirochaetia bacterium]|nr:gamma-glutamyltransferase [Spirochaetia bacterium]